MRMRLGDVVECCDQEWVYLCRIITLDPTVTLSIDEKSVQSNKLLIQVTIARVVRRKKTKDTIRKLTELGCFAYNPVAMVRSVVKGDVGKFDRWQTFVKEASEQAKRTKRMQVLMPITWKELLVLTPSFDVCLVADVASKDSFKDILNTLTYKLVLTVIGPEGGFDPLE